MGAKRRGVKSKPRATPKKKTKPAPRKRKPIASARGRSRVKRLTIEEIDRRLAIARGAAARRKIDRSGLQQRLASALEVAQMMAIELGHMSTLKIAFPPRTHEGKWKTPWTVIGRFVWKAIGYAELWAILNKWTQRRLENRINKDRIARLRINYVTDRGKREEYTLAETGPWAMVLARAMEQCDPEDTDTSYPGGRTGSLASRYPDSTIESVYVWLSESVSVDVGTFGRA
jgi:hypothetical protein